MGALSSKVKHIQKILNTEYFPIGIKIIQNSHQSWDKSFQEIKCKKRFCYYIRLAAQGQNIVIRADDNPECYTPYLCLGFTEPEFVDYDPRIKPATTKAVVIGPLHNLKNPIDSVVFIVNAKQAMLLVGALRRLLKKNLNATFGASMAVCGEVVAQTIVNNTPNLSMLCHGARIFSGYTDEELAFGIPFQLFEDLYSGLKKVEKMQEFELTLKNREVN
ncbi:MAG: DUF169 domain-containing protein [Candidatus Helarchaeota archaeon]|nr:DUF169 domain-containing protein [Candidatus Helarchaeota archaeon]